MREIKGLAKSVRERLGGTKYVVDYYQREYKWEKKHVSELVDDLSTRFLEDYQPDHERKDAKEYGHYFLGSIIISEKDGQKFIVDGQQRLTTLTLLLIYLHSRLEDADDKAQVAPLIFSRQYGQKSFNIDVPERATCMDYLYRGTPIEDNDHPESVRNILGRYADIEDLFPEDLSGEALPFYADWLIDNVNMVEITTYTSEDAYTIFETMNDRGLSLSPTDMLKGYLLANIHDDARRARASDVWKEKIRQLTDLGRDEDADCLKSWFRSQYAKSIRERKRGALPKDFDKIGSEFHRWIRDNAETLGLRTTEDFAAFIERDFGFYARQYIRIRQAADDPIKGLEAVFYNAQHSFTLQYPVLLSPVRTDDAEQDILRKLRIVAAYLDILLARRIWNFRAIDYSTMQYAMFLVMRDIRGQSVVELAETLRRRLDQEDETFASNERFRLHGQNGRQIHRMLARMIDYVETRSGMASRYSEYVVRSGKKGYEIEHIWADHPERHADEFPQSADFEEYRNRFGGLLLLPKSFNASYSDLPYEQKREHYNTQNLLARSLYPLCYERNPGFLRFVQESGLPFLAHEHFRRADLDARHDLYRQLAEEIWNPDRLNQTATA